MLACSIVKYVSTFLQVALAVCIVGVVAAKLQNVTLTADFGTSTAGGPAKWAIHTQATCSLGTAVDSSSLCTFTYVLAGLTLLISLAVALVKCMTCNLCGCGGLLDIAFWATGTCGWAFGASVVTKHVQDAGQADLPLQQCRVATVAMMWGEVLVFGALVVTGACGYASRACCMRGPRFQKLEASK